MEEPLKLVLRVSVVDELNQDDDVSLRVEDFDRLAMLLLRVATDAEIADLVAVSVDETTPEGVAEVSPVAREGDSDSVRERLLLERVSDL